MDEIQSIKFRRSASVYDTKAEAVAALNAQVFFYGIPTIVKYKVGEEINAILALGITEEIAGASGEAAYRIVSDSKSTELTDDLDKYQSAIEGLEMPNAVGGISAGTSIDDLRNQSFTKLFDDLLFPTILPIANNKGGLSLSRNPGTQLFEIGASQAFTFTPSFNRGSYTLNGKPIAGKFYLGEVSNYEYFKGAASVQTSSINPYTVTEVIEKGVVTYKVTATYPDGDVPEDNKGALHPETQGKAGTKDASISVEGTYPWHATTTTTGVFDKQPLRSLTSKNKITGLHFAPGNVTSPQGFKLPADMAQPTSMKLLNNLSGKYDIDESMSNYTVTDISENVNGSTIAYKNYSYNGGAAGPVRDEVNLEVNF